MARNGVKNVICGVLVMASLDENAIILTMYTLIESAEETLGCDPETAYHKLSDLLRIAAEERIIDDAEKQANQASPSGVA